MPALVEVEVIRRDLEREIVGRRIKDVEIKNNRNAMKVIPKHGRRKEFQALLEQAKIDKVDRRGKRILMTLDNGNVMMVDLGETGQLLKTSASGNVETHTHLVVTFTIGGQLRLVDPQPTSEIFVGSPDEIEANGYNTVEGIDPLEQQVTWPHFSGMLEEREQPMKDLLMDEKFIVGLGNMYSDEILWTSALRYDRSSDKLTSQDVRRLYRALIETLQESLKARGTSEGANPFTDLTGVPGQYQLELKVFEREGDACKRCRTPIVKEKYRDGFTYLCPQCQS
ncbi:MAG: formamidopyrimidine-DNA glycosylase [Actinomycetota bacterium]|jgi:formamidopyrimidine-DNA glycosylase|nr:formamidopyrimidine-DNA glycosylase [Actinomycetota bacterium]